MAAANDTSRSGAYLLFSQPSSSGKPFQLGVAQTVKKGEVDFGSYMADLQRRIKRVWFPPKGNESKKVVVIFKVHNHGELSNLKLDRSSGLPIADNAAIAAVEHAAPFLPLPPGAPKDVDIQFTFDYNVFVGNGHGIFRQF
jgi:TonB family protein